MKNQPVDIIIPVFNSQKYLAECIESLFQQTFREFRILALDDCSTDGSFEILNTLKRKDNRLEIFKNEQNKGHIFSRNKLLDKIEQVATPLVREKNEHVFHLYVIKCKFRDELRKYLKEHGITTSLNYSKALPFYEAYNYLGHIPEDFPFAYNNQSKILSLPIFPEIQDAQISYVAETIASFYSNLASK